MQSAYWRPLVYCISVEKWNFRGHFYYYSLPRNLQYFYAVPNSRVFLCTNQLWLLYYFMDTIKSITDHVKMYHNTILCKEYFNVLVNDGLNCCETVKLQLRSGVHLPHRFWPEIRDTPDFKIYSRTRFSRLRHGDIIISHHFRGRTRALIHNRDFILVL